MIKTKAHELAEAQREISVSEFFAKNRHLLGFDNPRKALLMAVKEGVDNSLDAAQEAGILPDINIEVHQLSDDRFRVVVEDNGPGIIKEQIPKIFGKLLYGSKFHKYQQHRGQQGIGISAVLLYGQLTTGKGMHVISKIGSKYPSHYYEIFIDTQKNEPVIKQEKVVEFSRDNGTRVEVELQGSYQKGRQSVDEYVKEVALINPHANIFYKSPDGEKIKYPRAVEKLPREAREIKPHPYGVELGVFLRMLQNTKAKTLGGFLQSEFSRVSSQLASKICKDAKVEPKTKPRIVDRFVAENVFNVIQKTKIIAPPTDCLSPLGDEALVQGLKKEINADFYHAVSRSPSVYRGMPFCVEVGLAYGGDLNKDEIIRVMRFANMVPLLYQQGACAITESVIDTAWRNYGLSQSSGSLPIGPLVVVVHFVSVWVPFTSEAKEAIAHYPEVIKEIKLGLQEAGRALSLYIKRNVKAAERQEKINMFEKYIPELSKSLANLTASKKENIEINLNNIMKKVVPAILNGENENGNDKE